MGRCDDHDCVVSLLPGLLAPKLQCTRGAVWHRSAKALALASDLLFSVPRPACRRRYYTRGELSGWLLVGGDLAPAYCDAELGGARLAGLCKT